MPKGPPEMGMGKGPMPGKGPMGPMGPMGPPGPMGKGPMSMGKDGKDGKGGKGQVPWGLGMLIFFCKAKPG